MLVKWKMGIGFAGCYQEGEVEIEDEELEGKSEEEIEEIINKEVWEDAVQYIDTGWEIVEK